MDNLVLINHNKNWGLQSRLVEELANKALEEKGYKKDVELSVYFVGRKKAKDLNVNYRNMSYIPQVLGFPMSKKKDVDGKIRLGDIVICTQKLKYEVKFQNSDLETVLYSWLVHGVENLLK
ncbi:MAG: rRNA maturation RNase YbeY [Candidatus Shapirobacteria bacterium]|nr:rRNA maturation RNase YbeY [Candidatus Shapirobacteria bacterium]MDD4382740.1 rRNA maturation RNase YbeY [Candidatus Shapirobacteria bacterium]